MATKKELKKNKKKEVKRAEKEVMKMLKKNVKHLIKNISDERELLICTSEYGLSLALQNKNNDDFSLDTFKVASGFGSTDVNIQGMRKTKEGGIKQIPCEVEWVYDDDNEVKSVILIEPKDVELEEAENFDPVKSQEYQGECELRDFLLGRNPEDVTYRLVDEEDENAGEPEMVDEECTVEDSQTNFPSKTDDSSEIGVSTSASHAISHLVRMTLHHAYMKDMVNLREEEKYNVVEQFYRKMAEYIHASLVENIVPNFNLFFHPLFKSGLNITDGFEVRKMRDRIKDFEPRLNTNGAVMHTLHTDFDIHRLFMMLKKILGKRSSRRNLVWNMDPKPYIMEIMRELRPDYTEQAYNITQNGKSVIDYCNEVAELYGILFVVLIPNKDIFYKSGIIQAMRNPEIFHPTPKLKEDLEVFTNRIVEVYDGLQLEALHDLEKSLASNTTRSKYTTELESVLLESINK